MHWVEFSVYQFQNPWRILGKKANEACDKGFFKNIIFDWNAAVLSYSSFPKPSLNYIYILEIINVDFENISWFIQNEWFIYKLQKKIKIPIGMVDRILME